jgi:hypothetical protein
MPGIFACQSPDLVVEYYYEGNDFKNNLAFVRRHSSVERLATLKPADAAKEIDEAIAKYASEFSGSKESFNHFPFLSFMVHVAVGNVFGSVLEDEIERTDRNPPTIVDIAGKAQEFPGRLQAPALELSETSSGKSQSSFSSDLLRICGRSFQIHPSSWCISLRRYLRTGWFRTR